jgi:Flp pilus assembly protein TadG
MPNRVDPRGPARSAVAAVELAILLPFLTVMFLVGVDWARIFYFSQTLTNCARQGAIYGSNPDAAAKSPYKNLTAAALADAPNLSPQPTVTSTTGTDAAGNAYVTVTVSWQFSTIAKYPLLTSPLLTRSVTMRVVPSGS